MSFVSNLNPVFLDIGPFHIRYYGLVYALGFLAAYLWLMRKAKRQELSLSVEEIDELLLILIPSVILGARIFEIIFYEPAYYFSNPAQMIALWNGGMSFHGGLVGAALGTWLFVRRANKKRAEKAATRGPEHHARIHTYILLDQLVPVTAIALFFGRIANFINGELWGTVTNVPWCVYFPGVEGCRHPSQLYEALYTLLIFAIILIIVRAHRTKKKTLPDGFVFWLFALLYAIFRFIENFWRDDPRWLGLSMGQYLCIALAIASAIMLKRIHRHQHANTHKSQSP